MNKQIRAAKKIARDKEKKELKRRKMQNEITYDNVYSYEHFVNRLYKCFTGVGWKASVQNYMLFPVTKMYTDYLRIKNRDIREPISTKTTLIYERGKARIINPIHVRDRLTQKVLCDYALTPIIMPKLIYDNGASLPGKGVNFARKRLFNHLMSAIKNYGTDFYVLSFDFKSFFDSVPHSTCRMMLERYIDDKELVWVTMEIIKSYHRLETRKIKDPTEREEQMKKLENDELCGICLGSQVSQIMALVVANDLDHYIKDKMGRKYYERYMDDGIIFGKTKEELQELLVGMKEVCDKLGLTLHPKKTHITHIKKGFTFLKVRYFVTDTGKIVRKLARQGIVRMRHKLKKLKVKVDKGELTLDNVYDSMQSWVEHSKIANSYITYKNMMHLYDKLFGGYKLTKHWKHKERSKSKHVLQTDKWEKYCWGHYAV